MRYIISLLLVIASVASLGFTALIAPVGATTTVSGEARITSPVKPRPVIKVVFTAAAKARFLETKNKLLTEIATLKESITKYDAMIVDIKAKIDAQKKAWITNNTDLKIKMNALVKAKVQAKKDIAALLVKLAYVEAKLK